MKDKLVSDEEIRALHPAFRGKNGDILIKFGKKVTGLNNALEVYDRSKHLSGVAFSKDVLDKLELKRIVMNVEVLNRFEGRPFIIVANHPNGHVDGIALIETVASRVPRFRIMVNYILSLIDTMSENFIAVNPYKTGGDRQVTFQGIRECLAHIAAGNPLGLFPAGSASRLKLRNGKFVIRDREWQTPVIRLIQKAKVPVIPVYIDCRNSYLFYAARWINWQLQSLAQCHELYNKKGKEMVLTFGEPIMPEEINLFPDPKELGEFLKIKTYALKKNNRNLYPKN